MGVNLPLTGAGGTTATVATEQIGGAEYQYLKLIDANAGSTLGAEILTSAPTSADVGLVVRAVPSTNLSHSIVVGTGGTTANTVGSVALVAGSSDNTVGSVTLAAGSSGTNVGQVTLQQGTTNNYQFVQSIAFSSGNVSRSSVSTTVDTQLIAANSNRKALILANRSTSQTVGVGFSTASVTTALANVDLFLGPSASLTFGTNGVLPLYRGPLRGINLTSTTVAGSVALTEFT